MIDYIGVILKRHLAKPYKSRNQSALTKVFPHMALMAPYYLITDGSAKEQKY